MIKKLLLLIIPFLLFSCNDDDDRRKDLEEPSIEQPEEKPFDYDVKQKGLPAPPQWLKGKWEIKITSDADDPYRNKKDIIEVTDDDVIHNGESFKEKFKNEEILAEISEDSYSKEGRYIFYIKSNREKGSMYTKYTFWYWNKNKFSFSIKYTDEKGRNIAPPIRKVREYKRIE